MAATSENKRTKKRKNENATHNDLRKKLIVARAISTESNETSDFSWRLASQHSCNELEIQSLQQSLANNLYKYFKPENDGQQPTTYEIMRLCTALLNMGNGEGRNTINFAQMSFKDWVDCLDLEQKNILIEKINEIEPDEILVEICKECGIYRSRNNSPEIEEKNKKIAHDKLHPVYLDVAKFDFCDMNKHEVSEIQKYMYFDSQAISNWQHLISKVENYPNYKNCLMSLGGFLGSPYWGGLIDNNEIDRTVSLGAGTPEKDRAIVSSCIKQISGRFSLPTHYVIDTSFYMLMETLQDLCFTKIHGKRLTRNEIVTISGDFMRLSKLMPGDRKNEIKNGVRRTAYFMLGGTIGNINPVVFMESIEQVVNEKDLLVISAEFLPEDKEYFDAFIKNVNTSYDDELAKKLVAPAARAVLRAEYGEMVNQSLTDAMIIERLKVRTKMISRSGKGLCNFLRVTFDINYTKNHEVIQANRYLKSEFKDFVVDRGFTFISSYHVDTMELMVFEKS